MSRFSLICNLIIRALFSLIPVIQWHQTYRILFDIYLIVQVSATIWKLLMPLWFSPDNNQIFLGFSRKSHARHWLKFAAIKITLFFYSWSLESCHRKKLIWYDLFLKNSCWILLFLLSTRYLEFDFRLCVWLFLQDWSLCIGLPFTFLTPHSYWE